MRAFVLGVSCCLASAMFSGCVSGSGSGAVVPAPTEAANAAARAGIAPGEIARAADLYALKCARCHRFYDPAAYPDAEWTVWMAKMSRKSRLIREDEALLGRYLDAWRRPAAQAPPVPPQ